MTRLPTVLLAATVALALVQPAALRAETAEAATAAAPAAAAPSLPAITVSAVKAHPLRDRVVVSGMVGPVEQVLVHPLIEGQPIEALEADVGDTVTEGQVLARLSSSTLELERAQLNASAAAAVALISQSEAQLVEAQASSDEATRVKLRTAQLRSQGSATEAAAQLTTSLAASAAARVTVALQGVESAKAQAALVQAQMANLDLQLARTQVVAPVAGHVVAREARLGAIASASGAAMFTLIRDGALELRADVAEGDLVRLSAGQTATLTTVGAGAPLTGTVRLVEPTIDTTSRLGRARITIDTPEGVRSGMFMQAEVLVAARDGLAVPVTALGADGSGATVMKVTDGQVSRVEVKTGIRDGGLVEILSGLAAGDLVVSKAASFVRDGDRINPVPAAAGTN